MAYFFPFFSLSSHGSFGFSFRDPVLGRTFSLSLLFCSSPGRFSACLAKGTLQLSFSPCLGCTPQNVVVDFFLAHTQDPFGLLPSFVSDISRRMAPCFFSLFNLFFPFAMTTECFCGVLVPTTAFLYSPAVPAPLVPHKLKLSFSWFVPEKPRLRVSPASPNP